MKVSDFYSIEDKNQHHCEAAEDQPGNNNLFSEIITNNSFVQKMKCLQEISGKDSKELWQSFCDDVLEHLHSLRDVSRFDHVQKLIQDSRDFDLDKRHMGILIMESLV